MNSFPVIGYGLDGPRVLQMVLEPTHNPKLH